MSVLDLCPKILGMSTPRLVIDTNVLLDLFVFADPRVATLHDDITSKQCLVFFCSQMLDEFRDVLGRAHFGLSDEDQNNILRYWQELGTQLTIEHSAPVRCSDPDDLIFIDLAFQVRPAVLYSKDLALINLRSNLLDLEIELLTY